MNVADWLAAACADADKRGLSELRPLLESLARSTTALRTAADAVASEAPAPERADGPAPDGDA
jgi:hypothetical protein